MGTISSIPRWTESYNGIPFTTTGFNHAGCHCWGLVRLVLGEQRGLWLPTYGEISARELAAIARTLRIEKLAAAWSRVEAWQPFDVVLMAGRLGASGRRAELHCAVAVSADHLLHVEEATASVCVRRDHPSVRFRIIETYRHASLT